MFKQIKMLFTNAASHFNWMKDAETAIHLLTDKVEALEKKLEVALAKKKDPEKKD